MKYREKLLEFIFNEDEAAFSAWIQSHPELEQPDIFREFKIIIEELAVQNGDHVNEVFENFQDLEAKINDYEEIILDEKLAEAQYIMEQEENFKEADRIYEDLRNTLIDGILENKDNTDLRELAAKMIQNEKDHGLHNPEDWKRIL